MPGLFDTYEIRGLTLKNRIVMPPMCMWASDANGAANDWHFVHYGARAVGGMGLIIVEVNAVAQCGRIDDMDQGDLGIWDDCHIEPMARFVKFCREQGAAMAIQIGHAGRKAYGGEKGRGAVPAVAPSAIPFDDGWETPHALTLDEIPGVIQSFRDGARRALAAGFQAIEIHGAHGYLLSSFLSPLANHRSDAYGGDINARARLVCEVTEAVRSDLPDEVPIIVRVSATDWKEGGNTIDDLIAASKLLKGAGADMIHVSSGGNHPGRPSTHPGYMVGHSEAIRQGADVPTIAVGLIRHPELAEEVIRNERADLVAIGREMMRTPAWPYMAAARLGVDMEWPEPYETAKL